MKYIMITGASSGIGEETARFLARQEDVTTILVARNEEKLKKLVNEFGGETKYLVYDLTDVWHIESCFIKCREWGIKLDGLIHCAGIGENMNFGWQRDQIIEFMEEYYRPDFTAKTLSSLLLDQCDKLYGGRPGDDTTVCVVKIRERKSVNLLMGPPRDPADVNKMMSLFFGKTGKHIVCGGTTSTLAADFLGKEVKTDLKYLDPEIPPIAEIDGVDLTTEGVITMSRVLEYAKSYLNDDDIYADWSVRADGASQIARILFQEATDINFFVGTAINPAHQNPNLPINFNIKMQLVTELSEYLKKMGKRIKVSYF